PHPRRRVRLVGHRPGTDHGGGRAAHPAVLVPDETSCGNPGRRLAADVGRGRGRREQAPRSLAGPARRHADRRPHRAVTAAGYTPPGILGQAAPPAYGVNAAITHTWLHERAIHIESAGPQAGPGGDSVTRHAW